MKPTTYRVIGMDCANDARAVEDAARAADPARSLKVSAATHILTADSPLSLGAIEAVSRLGYGLEHSAPDTRPTSVSPAYRRALWIVVALNVGYGVAEMIGGFLSASQAVKADALDFIGDGLITFLGIVAIGWSLRWRARTALIQGVFLGALGVGVLVATGYRVLVQQQPEAEVMGVLGAIALAVNVTAAAVLRPHRAGDANARAVWLFSRNDAIGNAAVIVAAFLVSWTGTSWPDLVVAGAIAALFLHSSVSIVRDAITDLR